MGVLFCWWKLQGCSSISGRVGGRCTRFSGTCVTSAGDTLDLDLKEFGIVNWIPALIKFRPELTFVQLLCANIDPHSFKIDVPPDQT
jgi:hypothetical protein